MVTELASQIIDFSTIHLSSVIAVLIGAILGFTSSYLLNLRRERIRQQNLRMALISELETSRTFFDIWVDAVRDIDSEPPEPIISTVVYENNLENIGHLTENEIDALVDYYSYIISFKKVINGMDEMSFSDGDSAELLNRVKRLRETALVALREEKSDNRWFWLW
jgi:hypothetical protein